MNLLRPAALLAIVGGLAWVVRWLLSLGGSDPSAPLYWLGAALLTLAGAIFSFVSVRKAPMWLEAVVAVCGPVAAWMVLLSIYEPLDSAGVDQAVVDGVLGLAAILVGVLRWRTARPKSRHRGSHTAP